MDLIRFGRGIRALRHRRTWRQQDLATAAGVSPSMVARVERGDDTVQPRRLDAVAAAVGARSDLRLLFNGEARDRLMDAGHAALVDLMAGILRGLGWEVVVEATFWIRGERGSIDLLAWHPGTRIVLVIEVKSVVPDLQAMLSALDRKVRLAREIARERRWNAVPSGRCSSSARIGRLDGGSRRTLQRSIRRSRRAPSPSGAGSRPLTPPRRSADSGSCQRVKG